MSTENSEQLICAVKNCQNPIEKGKEIKINGKIYCPQCGVQIMTQTFT